MPDTPANAEYLFFGLIISFAILGVFITSMVSRYRSLQQDVEVMEKLAEEE